MSGWRAVAEKLLGRRASEPASSYEIDCACGRKVGGTRGSTEHVAYCVACGTALFVLPQSVYPRPRANPAEPAASPKTDRARRKPVVISEPPVAERPPEAPPPSQRESGTARNGLRTGRELPAPPEQASPQPRSLAGPRPRRRIVTPVRLVLAGVAAVISLTVWWSLRVAAHSQAERTIVTASRLAQQALEENDLAQAARHFQEVRQALDVLGRTDSRAREMRQTADEITASAELARSSLFDILHEAAATTTRSGKAMWDDTFRSSYRDEWVLIDAHVTRTAEPASGRKFSIEFPLADGADRAVVVGDLACFERIVQGGSSQRVIFAAQLEDVVRDAGGEKSWQFVLRPATAFLWAAPDNLERIGVDVDDDTRRLLADQSGLLGVYQ
ncbi:MAG: hypothetical protein HY290_07315 [Planctomycetia bacterium]|nr:hypothetical protein [Planctomycetia bacterium]